MTDYRLELKVKNNLIMQKIEDAGYKTVSEFCRMNNLKTSESQLGAIINLKRTPLNKNGDFAPIIKKVALLLGCAEEDLFTEVQLHTELKTNKRVMAVNEAEMRFALESSEQKQLLLEEIVEDDQKVKAVETILGRLTPREAKIIKMRNGLDGYVEHTLEECAIKFDVNRERIRQIEAKALRKLRHPNNAEFVREFVEHD